MCSYTHIQPDKQNISKLSLNTNVPIDVGWVVSIVVHSATEDTLWHGKQNIIKLHTLRLITEIQTRICGSLTDSISIGVYFFTPLA